MWELTQQRRANELRSRTVEGSLSLSLSLSLIFYLIFSLSRPSPSPPLGAREQALLFPSASLPNVASSSRRPTQTAAAAAAAWTAAVRARLWCRPGAASWSPDNTRPIRPIRPRLTRAPPLLSPALLRLPLSHYTTPLHAPRFFASPNSLLTSHLYPLFTYFSSLPSLDPGHHLQLVCLSVCLKPAQFQVSCVSRRPRPRL